MKAELYWDACVIGSTHVADDFSLKCGAYVVFEPNTEICHVPGRPLFRPSTRLAVRFIESPTTLTLDGYDYRELKAILKTIHKTLNPSADRLLKRYFHE